MPIEVRAPRVGYTTTEITIGRWLVDEGHWVEEGEIRAFQNSRAVVTDYRNGYAIFDAAPGDELTICYPLYAFDHHVEGLWPQTAPELELRYAWLGNMVTAADPQAQHTPLFSGLPRQLPPAPDLRNL